MSDPRRPKMRLPEDMLSEVRSEAERQGRSMSWVVQRAWKLARERLRQAPEVVR